MADEVRYHWACVKRLLDAMVDLAKEDNTVAAGISRFFGDAALNFLNAILGSTRKLKRRRSKNERQIAVEVMNVGGCETHRSAPDDAVAV
ncbi:MAG TPA: hypothetical protein PK867_22735 [Pirellulales bacterium]|nr:hypothetical protein [Pirellulales bacterium]